MELKRYFLPKKFYLSNYLRPLLPLAILGIFFALPNSIISAIILGESVDPLGGNWEIIFIFLLMTLTTIIVFLKYTSFAKDFFSIFFNICIPLYFIHLVVYVVVQHGIKTGWVDFGLQGSNFLWIGIFAVLAGFFHGNYLSYVQEENRKKFYWYTSFEVFFIVLMLIYAVLPIFTENASLGSKLFVYFIIFALLIFNRGFLHWLDSNYQQEVINSQPK